MPPQADLGLDFIFTEKFFIVSTEWQNRAINITFELPNRQIPLSEFLPSEKGKAFLANLKLIFDQIYTWACEHKVAKKTTYDRFIKDFIEYQGNNEKLNIEYITFYIDGTYSLVEITELLQHPDILTSYKEDTIENFFVANFPCGGGTYTRVLHTTQKLKSALDHSIRFQTMRKEYIWDLTYQLLENEDYHEGNRMHFQNDVTNHYSEALNIAFTDDDGIKGLNAGLQTRLKDLTQTQIRQGLTAKYIIERLILEDVNLNDLISDFNKNGYDSERLEKVIDEGIEKLGTDHRFIDTSRLFYFRSEYSITWRAQYILFLSIAERLASCGYLNPFEDPEQQTFTNRTLYYFNDRSLNYSYIHKKSYEKDGKQVDLYEPFIIRLAKALYGKNIQYQIEAFNFMMTKLSPPQKYELAVALIAMVTQILKKGKETDNQDLIVNELIKDIERLLGRQHIAILKHMPPKIFDAYYTLEREQGILDGIQTLAQLSELLQSLPFARALTLIGASRFRIVWDRISIEFMGFTDLLRSKTEEVRDALINFVGMKWIKTQANTDLKVKRLLLFMTVKRYNAYFANTQLSANSLWFYLASVPQKYYRDFLNCFHSQILINLFKQDELLLKILNNLPVNRRFALLQAMPISMVEGILQSIKHIFPYFAVIGEEDKKAFIALLSHYKNKPISDYINIILSGLIVLKKTEMFSEIFSTAMSLGTIEMDANSLSEDVVHNFHGQSFLYLAIRNGAVEIVDQLLAANADVNLENRDKKANSFTAAIALGNVTLVKRFLTLGAEINYVNCDGETPLYIAIKTGSVEIATILLEAGANVKAATKSGVTLLYMAAMISIEMVNLLLQYNADVKQIIPTGFTPLHYAGLTGKVDIVKRLLEINKEPNLQTDSGGTVLYFACLNNHIEVVQHLLAYSNIDLQQPNTVTVAGLRQSGKERKIELSTEYFIRKKRAREKNNVSITPEEIAFICGNREILGLLRKALDERAQQVRQAIVQPNVVTVISNLLVCQHFRIDQLLFDEITILAVTYKQKENLEYLIKTYPHYDIDFDKLLAAALTSSSEIKEYIIALAIKKRSLTEFKKQIYLSQYLALDNITVDVSLTKSRTLFYYAGLTGSQWLINRLFDKIKVHDEVDLYYQKGEAERGLAYQYRARNDNQSYRTRIVAALMAYRQSVQILSSRIQRNNINIVQEHPNSETLNNLMYGEVMKDYHRFSASQQKTIKEFLLFLNPCSPCHELISSSHMIFYHDWYLYGYSSQHIEDYYFLQLDNLFTLPEKLMYIIGELEAFRSVAFNSIVHPELNYWLDRLESDIKLQFEQGLLSEINHDYCLALTVMGRLIQANYKNFSIDSMLPLKRAITKLQSDEHDDKTKLFHFVTLLITNYCKAMKEMLTQNLIEPKILEECCDYIELLYNKKYTLSAKEIYIVITSMTNSFAKDRKSTINVNIKIRVYNLCIKLIESINNRSHRDLSTLRGLLLDFAKIYQSAGQNTNAIETYQAALKLISVNEENLFFYYSAVQIHSQYANLLEGAAKTEHCEKALFYAKKAFDHSKMESDDYSKLLNYYFSLFEAYKLYSSLDKLRLVEAIQIITPHLLDYTSRIREYYAYYIKGGDRETLNRLILFCKETTKEPSHIAMLDCLVLLIQRRESEIKYDEFTNHLDSLCILDILDKGNYLGFHLSLLVCEFLITLQKFSEYKLQQPFYTPEGITLIKSWVKLFKEDLAAVEIDQNGNLQRRYTKPLATQAAVSTMKLINPFQHLLKPPEYINIYDKVDGPAKQVLASEFAKEIGFTWGSGIVFREEDAEPLRNLDYHLSLNPPSITKIIADLNQYEPKLALLNMGEYGYGVITTEDIPSRAFVTTYYGHLNRHLFISDQYSCSITGKDGDSVAILSCSTHRNYGSYFQYAPTNLEKYIFNNRDTLNNVATENLASHHTIVEGHILMTYRALRHIPKGSLLVWNYGYRYVMGHKMIPALFTTTGNYISPDEYQIAKYSIRLGYEKIKLTAAEVNNARTHGLTYENKHTLFTVAPDVFEKVYQKYSKSPFIVFKAAEVRAKPIPEKKNPAP